MTGQDCGQEGKVAPVARGRQPLQSLIHYAISGDQVAVFIHDQDKMSTGATKSVEFSDHPVFEVALDDTIARLGSANSLGQRRLAGQTCGSAVELGEALFVESDSQVHIPGYALVFRLLRIVVHDHRGSPDPHHGSDNGDQDKRYQQDILQTVENGTEPEFHPGPPSARCYQ